MSQADGPLDHQAPPPAGGIGAHLLADKLIEPLK
jgi:hypothetical protein